MVEYDCVCPSQPLVDHEVHASPLIFLNPLLFSSVPLAAAPVPRSAHLKQIRGHVKDANQIKVPFGQRA